VEGKPSNISISADSEICTVFSLKTASPISKPRMGIFGDFRLDTTDGTTATAVHEDKFASRYVQKKLNRDIGVHSFMAQGVLVFLRGLLHGNLG
jgi:hypothetical protein